VQGPESYLLELGVELKGAVDHEALAILDPTHRIVVNGHYYWTSSAEHTAVFRSAPHRFAGVVRDPVTHEWFDPTASSPRRELGDEIIYFKTSSSFDMFQL
jgi:hypothetical protein